MIIEVDMLAAFDQKLRQGGLPECMLMARLHFTKFFERLGSPLLGLHPVSFSLFGLLLEFFLLLGFLLGFFFLLLSLFFLLLGLFLLLLCLLLLLLGLL